MSCFTFSRVQTLCTTGGLAPVGMSKTVIFGNSVCSYRIGWTVLSLMLGLHHRPDATLERKLEFIISNDLIVLVINKLA